MGSNGHENIVFPFIEEAKEANLNNPKEPGPRRRLTKPSQAKELWRTEADQAKPSREGMVCSVSSGGNKAELSGTNFGSRTVSKANLHFPPPESVDSEPITFPFFATKDLSSKDPNYSYLLLNLKTLPTKTKAQLKTKAQPKLNLIPKLTTKAQPKTKIQPKTLPTPQATLGISVVVVRRTN